MAALNTRRRVPWINKGHSLLAIGFLSDGNVSPR